MAEALTPPGEAAPEPADGAPVADEAPTLQAQAQEMAEQRLLDIDGDGDVDAADLQLIARRFRLAWLALVFGAFVLVGGGLAFALTRTPPPDPAVFAGGWAPRGEGAVRAQEIANHVAPAYRLEDGTQMVDVSLVPDELEGKALGGIAVQDESAQGGYRIEPTDNAVVYRFCGSGESCSIEGGEASEARGRLLKREALEVALLTFNFDGDADRVVVLMPPRAGSEPSFALMFERDGVDGLLDDPLATTIPPTVPTPSTIPADEAERIDALTEGLLFRFTYQTDSQSTPYLVLEPPSATGQ